MGLSTPYHGFKRRLYVSPIQSAWGTPKAVAFVFNSHADHDLLAPDISLMSDADHANGVEGPQKQYYSERSVSGTINLPVSQFALGIGLRAALGADTITNVGGSGTDYTHNFTQCAVGAFPGAVSLEEHANGATADSATDYLHQDIAVDKLTLSWGRTGFARLALDVFGSGVLGTAGNQTESGLNGGAGGIDHIYTPANKIAVFLKEAASEGTSNLAAGTWTPPTAAGTNNTYSGYTNLGSVLDNCTFTYANNYDRERARSAGTGSGSAIYATEPSCGLRDITFEADVIVDANTSGLLKALDAGTNANNKQWTIVIEAALDRQILTDPSYNSWAIYLPLVMLMERPKLGGGLNLATARLRFQAITPTAGTVTDRILAFVAQSYSAQYDA